MNKLEVRNLVHVFNKQEVLHSINFSVKDGEFLSILGPSGCGKTTILRILIGLLKPTSGTVLKDGTDITGLAASKRNMGIVFQNYALFQNMTVLGNVEYALTFQKDDPAKGRNDGAAPDRRTGGRARSGWTRSRAENIIELVGLTEHKDKKPYKLSGGQQQRVAIARTLAMNPEIILFDEPMSALDAATRLLLRDEIKEIQKKFRSTMIYITHDQEEAFALSDRIMVMDHGVIHQIDTPECIIKNPADEFVGDFVINNLRLKINSLARYITIDGAGLSAV
ncbi:MAG: ABC transporter ATP-binding protein [Treponema sp.]|jgi:ABC-type sugar transport system ATPase subunit|nr:ABC transporter ATP-binding protein [Treponema sp.]